MIVSTSDGQARIRIEVTDGLSPSRFLHRVLEIENLPYSASVILCTRRHRTSNAAVNCARRFARSVLRAGA